MASLGELFRIAAGRSLTTQELNNCIAYLALVRKLEGTDGPEGYRKWIGHKLFTSYDKHPGRRYDIKLRDKKTGKIYHPSAAGAYQFLLATYLDFQTRKGLFPDFTPPSQDQAAVAYLKDLEAIGAICKGDLNKAYRLTCGTWSSIPGGQDAADKRDSPTTRAQMKAYFKLKGGIPISG